MKSCQSVVCLTLLLGVFTFDAIPALPVAEPAPHQRLSKAVTEDPSKLAVIVEDVIPDVENTTQKVIRVNPLDVPSISNDDTGSSDSSLYKIQSLLPPNRSYVNSNRMRRPRPRPTQHHEVVVRRVGDHSPNVRQLTIGEPKLLKLRHQQPKHVKQMHFLYDQESLDGDIVDKTMNVHVAPGAYPVYYVVAKTNGRFGKYPIKSFRNPEEFKKYLLKRKVPT